MSGSTGSSISLLHYLLQILLLTVLHFVNSVQSWLDFPCLGCVTTLQATVWTCNL